MDVQIRTLNVKMTDGLEDYIRRRLEKLDRVNENVVDARIELRTEKNRSGGQLMVAEMTIATKRAIIRAEEKNHDLHTAIDLVIDRMATQIRRFHDKKLFNRRRSRRGLAAANVVAELETPVLTELDGSEADDEQDVRDLVRRKRFKIQPMNEDEAIEQMELLGHDFFLFFNPDEAQLNVLYRRRDGQYGLLQPELA